MNDWTDYRPSYLQLKDQDGVLIVTFTKSRLADDENLEEIGHELLSLVDQYHCQRIVVSLRGVSFITSSALGKLITLHRRLHRKGGHLVVTDLTDPVEEVFRTSRLQSYFSMAASCDEAIERLKLSAAPQD